MCIKCGNGIFCYCGQQGQNAAKGSKSALTAGYPAWIRADDRLPDDSIESFTGGPEGSWGIGVLVITNYQKGIRRLFGYFDADDGCFYSAGEKVDAKWWMVSPPEPAG